MVSVFAVLVNYLYASSFSFEVKYSCSSAGLLLGLFLIFLLVSLLLWGSVTKKPLAAGFLSLIIVYGQYGLASLFDLHAYFPSGLLVAATELATNVSVSLLQTIAITLALCAVCIIITSRRLKTMEWNERI